MASKRDIVSDIRSVFPDAGLLKRTQIRKYLRRGSAGTADFLADITPVRIGKSPDYLVEDIADKLYRLQGGAGKGA